MLKIVRPGERNPVHAGELRALVRVDEDPMLRFAPPGSHVQGLQDHVAGLLKELPQAYHGRVDVTAFGPGERIVFEPYSAAMS